MKILFRHIILIVSTMLIGLSAYGQTAQVSVDSIFINAGSIKKFNAILYPNDTITKGFRWFVNGKLELDNDSMKGFVDTVQHDILVTAVPITYQGVLGDTFAVKVVTNIPDRLKWSELYISDCLPVDTTYNNIPIQVSLIGYTPAATEKYKVVYDIENKDSVVVMSRTVESLAGSSLINDTIASSALGLGNFSMRIKHLYYGYDEGNHIDLSTKIDDKSKTPIKIELKLFVGVKPIIIDVEY